MTVWELRTRLRLPRPLAEVFAFFGDAANLQAITPAFLHFEILTPPPIAMQAGALIEYRIRLHGLPVRWQTEITAWEPPHRFVDEQRRGPYRLWVHEHTFEETAGGTLVSDRVRYAVPGFFLDRLANRFFVAPDLRQVFAYRSAALIERFGGRAEDAAPVEIAAV